MIKAQEAYEKVCQLYDSIDITDDLEIISAKIDEAVEAGRLGMNSEPYSVLDAHKAEKLAIYLSEEYGYFASVHQGTDVVKDGVLTRGIYINISWKYINTNVRESLNTRF